MSLLSIGTSCASCHTVDFLPTLCPACQQTFCSTHISSHSPCVALGLGYKETNAVAGPSTFSARGVCEVGGCVRMSIEGIAGLGGEANGAPQAEEHAQDGIAREIRCGGCGGAYCVEHRAQTSHDCTAPLAHNVRHDAFLSRRAQAQEVLARTFPEQAGRVIPKPPPPKDARRGLGLPKPATAKTTPLATPATIESSGGDPVPPPAKRPKTKEDKLWDVHVRKIKSLATQLKGSPVGGGEQDRRYFEWGLCDTSAIAAWEDGGKWTGKLERSHVPASMPLGKLLDLLMNFTKIPIPKSSANTAQISKLLLLDASPDSPKPRQAVVLRTDLPVGPQIPDGTTVVLCKG